MASRNIAFKALYESRKREMENLAYLAKLDQIQSAFTRFIFANKGLRLSEAIGKVDLAKACLIPEGAEKHA